MKNDLLITLLFLFGMSIGTTAQRTGYNTPSGVRLDNCNPADVATSIRPINLKINTIPGRSGGTGTESDPYIIASLADFNEMAERVTSNSEAQSTVFPNGNTGYAGQYFEMDNDIDAADIVQVGDYNHPFFGVFDGDGHAIKGLNFQHADFGGLFCRLGNGSCVRDVSLYGDVSGGYYCGVLTSVLMTGSSAIDVHNYCNLTSNAYYTGGIAGASYGTIIGCTNAGNITSTTDFIGGIAGDVYYDVYDCVNIGDITGATSTGGVLGYCSRHNMARLMNSGNIHGATSYCGGVAGFVVNYDNPDVICRYLVNTGEIITGSASVIGRLWHEGTNSRADSCYYDCQNTSKQGLLPGGNINGCVEPRFTHQMVGDGMAELLGATWRYEDGQYPIPAEAADDDIAICAAAPASFTFYDETTYNEYNTIADEFYISTEDGVTWNCDSDILSIDGNHVIANGTGSCTLTATKGNASKRYNLTVTSATQLDENASSEVRAFPNPANDKVIISGNNLTSIKIYDLTGRCVWNANAAGNQICIDTSTLQSGVYIISTENESGRTTHQKITIVR